MLMASFFRWLPERQCLHCINSSNVDPSARVVIAVYVTETSPFLRLALDSLASQTLAAEQVSVVVAIESGRSSERYAAIVANWSRDHAVRVLSLSSNLFGLCLPPMSKHLFTTPV
jgi:GT2 family glycosyltransferase